MTYTTNANGGEWSVPTDREQPRERHVVIRAIDYPTAPTIKHERFVSGGGSVGGGNATLIVGLQKETP